MSTKVQKVVVSKPDEGVNLQTYVTGFVASISLTLVAYALVMRHALSKDTIVAAIACLAAIQAIVQLIFFLHVGRETKPRWKLLVFGFMVVVVFIIVVGSIWIMNNLNYRMTPDEMNQYLKSQESL